jgi:hypothetical protein
VIGVVLAIGATSAFAVPMFSNEFNFRDGDSTKDQLLAGWVIGLPRNQ